MTILDVNTQLNFKNTQGIIGVLPSTENGQVVVHEQLNAIAYGLAWKDNVRVASTTNINISLPGTTIDGITMGINDRVLLLDQINSAENNIYIWKGNLTPMVRASGCESVSDLKNAITTVDEGTRAGFSYRQTQIFGTIGSAALDWVLFGTAAKSVSFVFGDGTTKTFTFTHGFNSLDAIAMVRENTGLKRRISVEEQYTSNNTVTLVFDDAPLLDALRIIIKD